MWRSSLDLAAGSRFLTRLGGGFGMTRNLRFADAVRDDKKFDELKSQGD
jgi:hypothetical protein